MNECPEANRAVLEKFKPKRSVNFLSDCFVGDTAGFFSGSTMLVRDILKLGSVMPLFERGILAG
jgi:hypothetical protein